MYISIVDLKRSQLRNIFLLNINSCKKKQKALELVGSWPELTFILILNVWGSEPVIPG